jgi:DNA-binding GntR family transcriptional regulator
MSSETPVSDRPIHAVLAPKIRCEALAGRVYEAIKEAILDLKMAPGARVNMDQLARELGVSISPIREALIRLTAERLVVCKPYSGYAVTPLPDKKAILDLIDARLLLEGQAARLGAPRRDPAILAIMNEALQQISQLCFGRRYREYRSSVEWDARLHGAIIASSGNSAFVQIYEDLHPHTQTSRLHIHLQQEIDLGLVLQTHLPIIRAYEQGDAEAAFEAIRAHMDVTRDLVSKIEP